MNFLRAFLLAALPVLPATAAEFLVNGRNFVVPDGFTVELVAGTNLVQRPVSAGFDDQGRLYVTDSSGSNEAPDKQVKNPTHRVLRLEDTDGDGIFDRSIVFADQVMFPQGCLWYDGSVYVAAPPSIWKFTDTDGDGVADRREEWFKGGTLTGCANDIHGPYLGPDGYIYWTKGAFAEQTHPLGNGRTLNDKAAHIYRARPDGSDLDVVMSGGMDNPVEVAFTPEGEVMFSSTFIDFTQPGFRDGVAHAIYGGVFGKVNDVLEDGRVKRTGPDLFHPFYEAGPAAECGLTRYDSSAFGVEYRDNLFATTFNLHKVTRHILRPAGATYASADSDFLTSTDPDFHPTDVLTDADGSLLVVDTGGWYRLCCPSSQMAKPDVLGAIYRVRRNGVQRPKDLWSGTKTGSELATDRLASDFSNQRRTQADRLVGAGERALPALKRSLLTGSSWRERQEAAWVLFRIGTPEARALLVEALSHADSALRRTAAKALSLSRDSQQTDRFVSLLANEDPALVRSGAEGLGRLQARAAVPAILAASSRAMDSFGEHSLIDALILIADPAGTRAGLTSPEVRTQRAALIALDQMDGSDLKATEVTPFLGANDERLRAAANWILAHHTDWGGQLAGWFREQLGAGKTPGAATAALNSQLRILTRSEAGQQLLADVVTQPGYGEATRIAALDAMAGAGLKESPASWKGAVRDALQPAGASATAGQGSGYQSSASLAAAVRAARTLGADAAIQAELIRVGDDAKQPAESRLDAYAALPSGAAPGNVGFDFLRSQLLPGNPPVTRSTAAGAIARIKLDPAQLTTLAGDLKAAGPLELNKLLGAFDSGGDEALGQQLLAALSESKSARALHPSQLKPHFAKFPPATQQAADAFLASFNADTAQQAAQLEKLLTELKATNADVRRGQLVFNGSKAACSTCHRIGYLGGDVGPELTKIGEVRTERDLLESIVYPSMSFVRSYEPTTVALKDGEQFNGIVRHETPEEILLVTGPGPEQRIRRSDIAELRPGLISVMPGGLADQLSRQELADLLTFVKTVRWR